jgi:hypothetical protein
MPVSAIRQTRAGRLDGVSSHRPVLDPRLDPPVTTAGSSGDADLRLLTVLLTEAALEAD